MTEIILRYYVGRFGRAVRNDRRVASNTSMETRSRPQERQQERARESDAPTALRETVRYV